MLIFDIETDGLLDTTTRLHCIAIHDTVTGQTIGYGAEEAEKGVNRLRAALLQGRQITGHNIIAFDIPVSSADKSLTHSFCPASSTPTWRPPTSAY